MERNYLRIFKLQFLILKSSVIFTHFLLHVHSLLLLCINDCPHGHHLSAELLLLTCDLAELSFLDPQCLHLTTHDRILTIIERFVLLICQTFSSRSLDFSLSSRLIFKSSMELLPPEGPKDDLVDGMDELCCESGRLMAFWEVWEEEGCRDDESLLCLESSFCCSNRSAAISLFNWSIEAAN